MTTDQQAPTHRATVREQRIEGFGTVRLRPVDPVADAGTIHTWVTQERARFWGMGDADRARVVEIYSYLDSLSTHHAYLVHRDDRPVALFQTYLPEHDPVGEYYDVQPGDFGVHLLIGPTEDGAEQGFSGALVSAFLSFVLADPTRRRIVAEPDTRNPKAIARLLRSGFVLGPEIELPEKRAQLVFLPRDDY